MVHALEKIHSLLNRTGYLIDIRPDGELIKFIRPLDNREHFIGYLHETDDYIEYRQADSAVQQVLETGLFQAEKVGQFEFRTYAGCFAELKTFVDETWNDSLITEDVVNAAQLLDDQVGEGPVYLDERVHIGLLKPNFKSKVL
ncbi:MAG: hypothetical protein IZT55_03840 [Anaerolineae bacterium]|nr:hypothetical protein [Anaerolineae bacterium]